MIDRLKNEAPRSYARFLRDLECMCEASPAYREGDQWAVTAVMRLRAETRRAIDAMNDAEGRR